MADDLEALYAHYRSRGAPPGEAVRRAEARLAASPETVERLVRLHRSGYRRLMARLPGPTRRRVEGAGLGMAILGLLAFAARLVADLEPVLAPGPLVWPILALGAATLALSVVAAHVLFVRRELPRGRSGRLSRPFPALAATAGFLGFGGALLTVRDAALGLAAGTLETGGVLSRIGSASLLVGTSLAVALAALAAWFLFARRAAAMRREEMEVLMGGDRARP